MATLKICLIILGYAGLSTNCKDLETFLRNSKNICKIIVDHLPFDNTINIYDCCELLQDPKKLEIFNCRTRTYQRLK
ncbi:hypothetical protein CLU79DRAFT_785035 [Phycomyces nitens]|nr:hypothetical protein CLU79DRAFT_785035 [Phycomyces nitens]